METHRQTDAGPYPLTIDPVEIRSLADRYGVPICRRYDIRTDAHLRRHRWRAVPDRRGEVIFVIRQPNGEILLHSKPQYEETIYRLPSGGIELDEGVEEALFREVAEEIGQPAILRRFLGLLDCHFHLAGASVSFPSYVFYLESSCAKLAGSDMSEIAAYRTVPAEQLVVVAWALRSLGNGRRNWGYWRSLPHDLVYRALTCPDRAG